MPLAVLFVVAGVVASSLATGAGVAYFQSRNDYKQSKEERIEKAQEDEERKITLAFELARDPLRRDPVLIHSLLRRANYGYVDEHFPANDCVGPPISNLEWLLQQGGSTGENIGDKIKEYYPEFHEVIGKTCRSMHGKPRKTKAMQKMSYLMYELFQAMIDDFIDLIIPSAIAGALTTVKLIKFTADEDSSITKAALTAYGNLYKDEKNWGFTGTGISYRGPSEDEVYMRTLEKAKKLTRDHFYGDIEYTYDVNEGVVEYVKRNSCFIPILVAILYASYLIGRYLVNKQVVSKEEMLYLLKQCLFSLLGSIHPFFYLTIRICFRIIQGENIFPRIMKAWQRVREGQIKNPAFSQYSWKDCFEMYLIDPIRILLERGLAFLQSLNKDLMKVISRFLDMITNFLRRGVIIPMQEFFQCFFNQESTNDNLEVGRNRIRGRASYSNIIPLLHIHPHSS